MSYLLYYTNVAIEADVLLASLSNRCKIIMSVYNSVKAHSW